MSEPLELVIEPGRAEANYWRDLWRFRELFGFLAWRDVIVRYKQTFIGVAWAILRPLLTMLAGMFFRRVTGMSSQQVPDSIFIFSALLPWQFFANSLSESSQSLVGNSNLISKIYFPRMILPASSIIVALVDFFITLGLLVVLMAWYQMMPTVRFLWLPAFTLLALVAALGPGLLITALNVKYRDFRYVIPFILQFGIFVTPLFYSTEEVAKQGEVARMILALNPMVAVMDGFRWAICGTEVLHWQSFVTSCSISILLLVVGIWYFRRTERTFADVI